MTGSQATAPAPGAADQGTGRDAILRAARRAFTQRPYAEVTIRGIAADAGVSPSLVVKHFGRKEELFNTVADFGPAAEELFDAPLDTLGRHMVVTLVRRRRELQSDPLLRVVFSLGNQTNARCCATASTSRSPRRSPPASPAVNAPCAPS
ncbi:helix-turn-helix domain-containing protein [Streptomyces sp. NPDC005181]|uniref:TetR/AcrR family transcriptional regulator n=1 Tax=Streptomyces sp. NPDC005181 TaxID=3156869 RepID=UPI0033B23D53